MMASKIKLLALGCTAAVLLGSAQAAVVLLDFEAIPSPTTAGTVVGGFYATNPQNFGVTFSANAIANHNGQSPGNVDPPPTRPAADRNYGFVRNAADSSTFPGDFTVQFDASKAYRNISLEWAAADAFVVTLFDDTGLRRVVTSNGVNFTTGWSLLNLSGLFGDNRRIDHISFSGNRKRFAIDNLRLDDATGGGNVPEPAGFGLVAVALAGAGLASRRSRKA